MDVKSLSTGAMGSRRSDPEVTILVVPQVHTHCSIQTLKTGTTSMWELSKMEESFGLVPGQVSTTITWPGATYRGLGEEEVSAVKRCSMPPGTPRWEPRLTSTF